MKKKSVYVEGYDKEFKKYCKKRKISMPSPPDKPVNMDSLIEEREAEITDYAAPYFEARPSGYIFTHEEEAAIFKAECKRYHEAMEKMEESSNIYENFAWYLYKFGSGRKHIDYDYWLIMVIFVGIPTITIGYLTYQLPNTAFFIFFFKPMIALYLIANALSIHFHST